MGYRLNGIEIESNLTDANIIEIGMVGFDWIRFTGFAGVHKFDEPITENYFSSINLDEHPEITEHDKHRVTIDGGFFIYKFGNMATLDKKKRDESPQQPFGVLDIRSAKVYGHNIAVLSVPQIQELLEAALTTLQDVYGLCKDVNIDNIKVKRAEISQTFPINHPFIKYERVFKLISFVLIKGFKGKRIGNENNKGKAGGFLSFSEDGESEIESAYVLKATSLSAKFYNKSQKSSEDSPDFVFDGDLCRFEINSTAQNLTSLAVNGPRKNETHTLYWCDITQESLESFYHNYVSSLFNNIANHLLTSIDLQATESSSFGIMQILDSSLSFVLRNTPDIFSENLLVNLAANENNATIILFDLMDLIKKVKNSSLKDINKTLLTDALNTILMYPERYSKACQTFIGQQILLDELKDNMLHPKTHLLMITKSVDIDDTKQYAVCPTRSHTKYNSENISLRTIYAPFCEAANVYYEKDIKYEYDITPTNKECRYPVNIKYIFFNSLAEFNERIDELQSSLSKDDGYYTQEERNILYSAYSGGFKLGEYFSEQEEIFKQNHPFLEYRQK